MKKSLPALVLVLIAIAGISFYAGKNSAAVSVDDVSAQQVEQTEEPADANVTEDTEENIADTMSTTQEPEKLDPSTLSDEEKAEIFEWVYDVATRTADIYQNMHEGSELPEGYMSETGLRVLNNRLTELYYKVTADIREEYIAWSDTNHPVGEDTDQATAVTEPQPSTNTNTQQSTTPSSSTNTNSGESYDILPNDPEAGAIYSPDAGEDTAMSLEDWLNAPPLPDTKPRAHF